MTMDGNSLSQWGWKEYYARYQDKPFASLDTNTWTPTLLMVLMAI